MAKAKEDYTEEELAISAELDEKMAIELAGKSKGGVLIVQALLADIVDDVDRLGTMYKEFTIEQFISVCADMKTKLDVYRTFTKAGKSRKELQEILKEKLAT